MTDTGAAQWDGRNLSDLLTPIRVGPTAFLSPMNEANVNGRIYGGQLMGQTVLAAAMTAPAGRPVAQVQFLFAAGGLPGATVAYDVASVQDGKRFTSRAVRGEQPGRVLSSAAVTFAEPIEGPSHQAPAPDDCGLGVDPDRLPQLEDVDSPAAQDVERTLSYSFRRHPMVDMRVPFVDDLLGLDPARPRMRFWARIDGRPPEGSAGQAAAFAYLSDYWINFVACAAHVRKMAAADARLYVASLNHVIWIHRPLEADQWLLFDCVSPIGASGRGLATGRVYDRSGALVATVAQECLLAPAG